MAVTGIRLEHFTAFDQLNLRPSRGVNVFVGTNGTGKTHLLKVAYAACDAARQERPTSIPNRWHRLWGCFWSSRGWAYRCSSPLTTTCC